MKKMITYVSLMLFCGVLFAQQEDMTWFDAFQKDKELRAALLRHDLKPFFKNSVTYVNNNIEKEIKSVEELNKLLAKDTKLPKNAVIKKVSETNSGWIQTFGIYRGDDPLTFIRFTLNPATGMLDEVTIERNN